MMHPEVTNERESDALTETQKDSIKVLENVKSIDTLKLDNGYMVVDNTSGRTTISLEGEPKNYYSEIIIGVLIVALLFLVYWFKYRKKKRITKVLKRAEVEGLTQNLKRLMEEDQVFKNQNLNLKMLASLLSVHEKKLSTLLNSNLDTNFYDFVKDYRLNYFIRILGQESYSNYSIIGLAEESGFKSKSVFYREFKKKYNMPPSQYQKTKLSQ